MSDAQPAEKHLIYTANAASHDRAALTHDRDVPYLARSGARRFYWNLLCGFLGGAEVWRNAAVLELGCGTGTFTDKVLAQNPVSFTGVDVSQGMLRRAREKYPDPRCAWVCAPLEEIASSPRQRYDVIHSFSFLHHLPDIPEALDQLRALLAPGGIYVGLHEIILPRERTWIERVDDKVELVFGTGRYHAGSFLSRAWKALPGRLTGYRPPTVTATNGGADLVDYQIKETFDLARFAGPDIAIHGYCYLAFPWLGAFDRPVNHRALVLKAPK